MNTNDLDNVTALQHEFIKSSMSDLRLILNALSNAEPPIHLTSSDFEASRVPVLYLNEGQLQRADHAAMVMESMLDLFAYDANLRLLIAGRLLASVVHQALPDATVNEEQDDRRMIGMWALSLGLNAIDADVQGEITDELESEEESEEEFVGGEDFTDDAQDDEIPELEKEGDFSAEEPVESEQATPVDAESADTPVPEMPVEASSKETPAVETPKSDDKPE